MKGVGKGFPGWAPHASDTSVSLMRNTLSTRRTPPPLTGFGAHDSPAHRRRQFDETLHRVDLALRAMGGGNPNPYIALWERSPDVTLYGAWGPIERGYDALRRTFEWVGSRFSDGELVPENLVIDVSGDLAYTVGFERGEVSVDGGPRVPMTIRVTHTYRYSGGEWRLIHRHADFPPKDQRGGGQS